MITLCFVMLQWPGSHLTRALVHQNSSSQKITAQYHVKAMSTEWPSVALASHVVSTTGSSRSTDTTQTQIPASELLAWMSPRIRCLVRTGTMLEWPLLDFSQSIRL